MRAAARACCHWKVAGHATEKWARPIEPVSWPARRATSSLARFGPTAQTDADLAMFMGGTAGVGAAAGVGLAYGPAAYYAVVDNAAIAAHALDIVTSPLQDTARIYLDAAKGEEAEIEQVIIEKESDVEKFFAKLVKPPSPPHK